MSFINNSICPSCGEHLPLFIPPSRRIRRSFFSSLSIRCENCGQACRARVSLKNAIWSWPLAIALLALTIYLFRTAPFLRSLHHANPLVYGLLAGALCGAIIGIGGRRGLVFVKPDETQLGQSRRRRIRAVVGAVLVSLFLAILGFVTHRWYTIVSGLIIGLIVWSAYYGLSKNKAEE